MKWIKSVLISNSCSNSDGANSGAHNSFMLKYAQQGGNTVQRWPNQLSWGPPLTSHILQAPPSAYSWKRLLGNLGQLKLVKLSKVKCSWSFWRQISVCSILTNTHTSQRKSFYVHRWSHFIQKPNIHFPIILSSMWKPNKRRATKQKNKAINYPLHWLLPQAMWQCNLIRCSCATSTWRNRTIRQLSNEKWFLCR